MSNILNPKFSLTCYNILANVYMARPIAPEMYAHVTEKQRDWDFRISRLRDQVAKINSDIYCLQEVDIKSFKEDWSDFMMDRGYTVVLQNDRGRKDNFPTANAVFFRNSKFALVSEQSRSRTMFVGLKFVEQECELKQEEKEIVQEDNNSTSTTTLESAQNSDSVSVSVDNATASDTDPLAVARQQRKEERKRRKDKSKAPIVQPKKHTKQRCLWIGNVHLEGDPYLPNARLSQMKSLLTKMQAAQVQFDSEPKNAMTIVCGDFNSEINGGVYRFLKDGSLDTSFEEYKIQVTRELVQHPFKFNEAYAACSYDPLYTFALKDHESLIDFVFFSTDNLLCEDVDAEFEMTKEDKKKGVWAPNDLCPSDHLPIITNFAPR